MSNPLLDDSQQQAISDISAYPGISVLTGGPGRGKTFTIKALLLKLWNTPYTTNNPQYPYQPNTTYLACPTGRAAKVLDEALAEDAEFYNMVANKPATIHRMLGCQGPTWVYTKDNPLPADLVVLDETSMVDSELLARVIQSTKLGCKFVLVGDSQQLNPVGPGNPFKDIIGFNKNVSRLEVNHRQRDGSLIANACELIQKGKAPLFGKHGKHTLQGKLEDDLFFEDYEDKEDIPEKVVELCREWHEQGKDYQVLSPQRNGVVGVENLNKVMQEALNPGSGSGRDEYVIAPWLTIREGDKVKNTKNNYELNIFNGFIGTVMDIDQIGFTVDFDGQLVSFEKQKDIKNLVLGYVITYHASQGSQYSKGIIICHSSHSYMLSRNLLYVGISRFKDELVVVGNKKGLSRAVKNVVSTFRNTYLREVFKGKK